MKHRKQTITLAWELQARACDRWAPWLPRWLDADDYPLEPLFALPVANREESAARGFEHFLLYEGRWP